MSLLTAPWGHFGETQAYGATGNPAEPAQFGHEHWHDGRDYAVPCGTEVPAPFDGRVTFAGWDTTGYGNLVRIARADGYQAFYGHLSQLAVAGGAVAAGTLLGRTGTTGNSTGCHLHLGSHTPDGDTLDPASFPSAPSAPSAGAAQAGGVRLDRTKVLIVAGVVAAAWALDLI